VYTLWLEHFRHAQDSHLHGTYSNGGRVRVQVDAYMSIEAGGMYLAQHLCTARVLGAVTSLDLQGPGL
jgi:hypothetical protein